MSMFSKIFDIGSKSPIVPPLMFKMLFSTALRSLGVPPDSLFGTSEAYRACTNSPHIPHYLKTDALKMYADAYFCDHRPLIDANLCTRRATDGSAREVCGQ